MNIDTHESNFTNHEWLEHEAQGDADLLALVETRERQFDQISERGGLPNLEPHEPLVINHRETLQQIIEHKKERESLDP